MNILVDDNVPLAEQCLSPYGRLIYFNGSELHPADARLKNADILIVRSVTRVNEELLSGTPVRFVGSTTTGTDHVDVDYLERQGIGFAHAPGANANSVSEYVFCAMAWTGTLRRLLGGDAFGIVGCGAVGSRVALKLRALGVQVYAFDPFVDVERQVPGVSSLPLNDIMSLPVCSLHVPLTENGPWATRHMIGERTLKMRPRDSVLINTSRGGTMATEAFLRWLQDRQLHLILDVWPDEPEISRPLRTFMVRDPRSLGTPHIAGHSVEGKNKGTWMVAEALARFLQKPSPCPQEILSSRTKVVNVPSGLSSVEALEYALKATNDLLSLSRELLACESTCFGEHFHHLRKRYTNPVEFNRFTVRCEDGLACSWLRDLGFQVEKERA